jgi:hypothetical protein
VSLGGTRIEEQSLKPFGEPLDDKVGPKTKVYDSWKWQRVKKWWKD